MLTDAEKEEVYEAVVELTKEVPGMAESTGGCVYYAMFTVEVLRKRGIFAVPQAGSAGWPRIRPEEDDGVMATHFSYMWTPNEPRSIAALMSGNLPEMHAWAVIPAVPLDQTEVVDMAAGLFPVQAKTLCGYEWPGPKPPKYLWARAKEKPPGVLYNADPEACRFLIEIIGTMFGMRRAAALIRT